MYVYDIDQIIKYNFFRPNEDVEIQLNHNYGKLYIHDDELYIIDPIKKQLIIFDKYTLIMINNIDISHINMHRRDFKRNIVVNNKYIIIGNTTKLYIYNIIS